MRPYPPIARLLVTLAWTAAAAASDASASAHAGSEISLYAAASPCDVARAGHPACTRSWATGGGGCDYTGYYVGGGAHSYWHLGRCPNQGTWGWDYTGKCVPPLVRLGWWNAPRRQGGTGSYAPDGPRFLEKLHVE